MNWSCMTAITAAIQLAEKPTAHTSALPDARLALASVLLV
jgi:hypothetical protein